MKTNLKSFVARLCMLLLLLPATNAQSQNVSVSGAVTGNGTYADLSSAFAAINGGAQTSANINVSILASTTETVSAVLNAGAWTTLSVSPSGGSYTVSGSIAGALVDLNGADNVSINGLNTGGNALTISNGSVGTGVSSVRFIADATNNQILNSTILGSGTSASFGTITFSTATTGNNNNTIQACNIGPNATGFPVNGIFSAGTSTATNNNNTIQNCTIYDYFSASVATRGILVSTNSSNWTITGNRFYQTAMRTYTTANTHGAIQCATGNNHAVTNNIIGYAAPNATGSYEMYSTVATLFFGINMGVSTATASSVQGNTISAISLTTSSGASTGSGILCGITIPSGNVNVGNLASNIIGGTSGTDLFSANPGSTGGLVVGIQSASTNTILIQNNYVGALTSTNSAAATSGYVMGINISGLATGLTITSNTIGNTATDNMRAGINGLTTANSVGVGIYTSANITATTVVISNNTIRNIASYGTGTGSQLRGIWTASASANGIYSIANNTITNLVTNSSNVAVTTGQVGTAGIILATGNSCTVTGNYIANIANTGTATGHVVVAGISNANGTNTVFRLNTIYDIRNTSPGTTATTPPVACGFYIRSGTSGLLIANNMISLGNGQASNTTFMGIYGNHGSTPNPTVQVYHNTINIEGAVTSGALSTFGIGRMDFSATARTAPYDVRNNIITNTRTGGTGAHYAIANNFGVTASSTTGWGTGATDNNILNANSASVGWWTSAQTLSGWKTASSCDANSYSGVAVTYVNSVSDLHLNMGTTPTIIESGGQTIASVTTDIDGQTRPGPSGSTNGGGTLPDIGADEIDGVPFTCTTAIAGTISPASGSVCAGQTVAATSASASAEPGITYQWQVGAAPSGPYVNVTGGSGATTTSYTSAALPAGVYYVVMKATCNTSIVATSNEVTLTVKPNPSVTISSASSITICSGQNFTLGATSNTPSTFLWSGPGSFTSSTQNPTITNAATSGVYSVVASANGCTSSIGQATVIVNAVPGSLTVTPTSGLICAGGSQNLNVLGGDIASALTFTPQINQNSTTSYPACYSAYYGGQKMQFLILASELISAGMSAGPLTSIEFPVVSLGANWGTSITECQNFQISIGQTASGALTTGVFQAGLTVVAASTNYTPVTGFNSHVFSSPFTWNGTSNIIVETVFSNNFGGTTSDAVIQYNSPTTFQSTMLYRADNQTFSTIAAATNTNGTALGLARPDFILRGATPVSFSWTPSTGLSATTGNTVNASPANSTTYVVTAANGACTSSTSVDLSVTPAPSLSIAASSTAVCLGSPVTLTASGAGSYTWSGTNNTGSVEVINPTSTNIYTVSNLTLPCGLVTETISITANALPTVSATAGSTAVCLGESTTLTASGASTYAWVSGPPTATYAVSPTSNTSYTVTGTDANGCTDDEVVSVTTNALPVVNVSPQSPTVCASSAVTFTASGADTYSWSSGSGVGTETVTPASSTSYTVTGTNTLGCSSMVTVSVTANPLPNISISPASTATVCISAEGSFTASGASTYSWSSGSTNTTLVVMASTNTIITVEGTDANGCKNTDTLSIVADPCTGLSEKSIMNGIKVFPNPSSGIITIEFGFEGDKTVYVTNSVGAVVRSLSSSNTSEMIDLSSSAKGIYFVKVNIDGRSANYKLVIE